MRKEEENSKGKLPWLEDTDERKYMTDREILDKCVNLDNSCLTKTEKTQVRDLLQIQRRVQPKRQDRTMSKHQN